MNAAFPACPRALVVLALLTAAVATPFAGAAEATRSPAPAAARLDIPLQAGPASNAAPAPKPRRPARYVWRVNNGDKISDAFRAWAGQANKWQVIWEAPELVAMASVDVEGSFEDAVSKVIDALNRGEAGLVARFYVDSANNVLRVMERK